MPRLDSSKRPDCDLVALFSALAQALPRAGAANPGHPKVFPPGQGLEKAGWLTRSADPTDRRRVLVTLTDSGRALTIAVNEELHRWEDRLGLPTRTRERIDTELDALLMLFED